MGHIDDTPDAVTDAGQDRNYTTPPPTAQLVLVAAPVDASLRVVGKGRAPYDSHIDSEVAAGRHWSETVVMYDPRRPLRVPISYAAASQFNYARLTFQGRVWYLFIDSIEYTALGTTTLNTTVDPFPTYPGWSLGYSMVKRSHAAVAASQGDTYGDVYCLAPEPVTAPPAVGDQVANILSADIADYTVIVISANDLRGNGSDTPYFEHHSEEVYIEQAADRAWLAGTAPIVGGDEFLPTGGGDHDLPKSLYESPYPWHVDGSTSWFVPSVRPSAVSRIDGVTQGGGAYLFTPAGYLAWISVLQGASWIMEGIVDIRLVPTWAVSGGGTGSTPSNAIPTRLPENERWATAAGIPVFAENITTGGYDATVLTGWRDTYLASIGAEWYRKLVTSQFTQVMIGTGEASTLYKPELMRSSGVGVHARTGMAHGENSVRLTVDYNDLTEQMATTMGAGGTPGSLASGYSRAAANTASASLGLANSAFNSYLSREAMEYNYALAAYLGETKVPMSLGIIGVQSVMQAAGGAALAGFAGAGPVGAAAGAVVGGGAALVTGALSANSSLDMLDISSVGSIDIGSYQLAVNWTFNAMSFRTWVQALRSTSGKGSAGAIAAAWRMVTGQAFQAIIVTPAYDQARQLLSTWRRYGYMIGRAFEPSRLDVMTKYSYWETENATILGQIPQEDRARIAEAFDRGVTIYNSLADIGQDVSTSNAPVAGFSY